MEATPSTSNSQPIEQVIQAYIAGAYESVLPQDISHALASKRVSLLELIRNLGQHLTSQHDIQRTRAVELLALVVTNLSPLEQPTSSIFDRQAIRTLTSFFASKLQDGETTATLIAQSLNSSFAPVPATAPSAKQLGKDGIPRGSEMLAAALKALAALTALDAFGAESAREVAENLIEHVHPRDHPQSLRFLVFALLDVLIGRHRDALRTLGDRFLLGYHDLVEGEKDPRNLMYLFAIDKVLLVEWEMNPELVEKYFDITFCYFPITFRPPPDDPYGITQADLKKALRGCLTATPAFAPHAMPLLLEKLAASNSNAKRDVLETLEVALPVYGRAAAEANGRRLWEGLKIEIFHATDDATSIASQRTLVALMHVLYDTVDPPAGLAPIIVADCLAELSSPAKVLAAPAASALVCLVRACPSTSYLATTAMLDRLLAIFQDPDEASSRASILSHIATLLQAMRQAYQGQDGLERVSTVADWHEKQGTSGSYTTPATATLMIATGAVNPQASSTRSHDGDRRPLDGRRDLLLSALSNGLQSQSYRSSVLLCVVHLAYLPSFLSTSELDYLCQQASALTLLPSAEDAAARASALDALRDIALIDAQAIERTTLPLLFAALPDRLGDGDSAGDTRMDIDGDDSPLARQRQTVRLALGALARLGGTSAALLDLLVVRLFTKLDLCCATVRGESADSSSRRLANVGYARGILLTLQTVFDERWRGQMEKQKDKTASGPKALIGAASKKQDVLMVRYAQDLPVRLCALVFGAALVVDHDPRAVRPVASDESIIQDVGSLLSTLVRHLDAAQQCSLTQWLYPVFLHGQFGSNLKATRALSDALSRASDLASQFAPLTQTSESSRNSFYLLSSVLIALHPSVPIPLDGDAVAWLGHLLSWTASSSSKLQVIAGSAALSTCANKQIGPRIGSDIPVDSGVRALLEEFWNTQVLKRQVKELEGTLAETRALKAWFSVARGFVVRTCPLGEEMVERAVVQLLDGDEMNRSDLDEAGRRVILGLAKATARTIGSVATPDDIVLTKHNGATVRLLYRQRFFSNTLPRLMTGYKTAVSRRVAAAEATEDPREMLYLMALSSFLPSMPTTLLISQVAELFPLLLRTLDLPDARARMSAAAAIDNVLAVAAAKQQKDDEESKEAAIRAHGSNGTAEAVDVNSGKAQTSEKTPLDVVRDSAHELISRLLVCCKPGPNAPQLTRIAALRCLGTIARSYPLTDATLHAEGREVLRILGAHRTAGAEGAGIDDPKRAVRLEAVDARDAWYTREGASKSTAP